MTNESLLKQYFGWSPTSRTPATYVHLSGKDLQNSILIMNGFKPPPKHKKFPLSKPHSK